MAIHGWRLKDVALLSIQGFHKGVLYSSSGFGAKAGPECEFCTAALKGAGVASHSRLKPFCRVVNLCRAKSPPWNRRCRRRIISVNSVFMQSISLLTIRQPSAEVRCNKKSYNNYFFHSTCTELNILVSIHENIE